MVEKIQKHPFLEENLLIYTHKNVNYLTSAGIKNGALLKTSLKNEDQKSIKNGDTDNQNYNIQ